MADPTQGAKHALRSIAQRRTHLSDEIGELETQLRALVTAVAPQLLSLPGVGINVAAALLVTVGDNPQRLRNEAAFARLCGVAPLPASSGRVTRHRLNPSGDRRGNNALYTIVLTRMRIEERTRTYVTRRIREGLSKTRNHPLPEALRRARDLPPPHTRPSPDSSLDIGTVCLAMLLR